MRALAPTSLPWRRPRHEVLLPAGALWIDALDYKRLTFATSRPQDNLTYDGLFRGEAVDPSLYYFRVTPYFETGAESYEWINKICSVATGARTASGPTYHVFQVL